MIEIQDKKEIEIGHSNSTLDAVYHKDADIVLLEVQVGNENISDIKLDEDETKELARWLTEQAEQMRKNRENA